MDEDGKYVLLREREIRTERGDCEGKKDQLMRARPSAQKQQHEHWDRS